IRSTTLTNFSGGHDTMTTLSAAVCLIASHSHVQPCLHHEMQEKHITSASSYAIITKDLSYLWACIKEAMRLYPAIGTAIPRVIPNTGTTVSPSSSPPIHLPPGTTASIYLYAIHCSPSLFPNHEPFEPERWL
ncbi:cytochrome P450, partial [Lentithecium fluviatile CBS 122367]